MMQAGANEDYATIIEYATNGSFCSQDGDIYYLGNGDINYYIRNNKAYYNFNNNSLTDDVEKIHTYN